MKKILCIYVLMLLCILPGCVKNEFNITFEFPKEHIGNYIVAYYAWDARKGTWLEKTASVQNGAAVIECVTKRPTLVYVRDASSGANQIAIYAERGDKIVVTGDNADMTTWTIKGNSTSERWSDWRKELARKKGDTGAHDKAIGEYVKANPGDRLSVILLLTEWDRRKDPDGFIRLWNTLDKKVRDAELIEMCASPDMTGMYFITESDGSLVPAREKKAVKAIFRSRDNGVDTLRFDKAEASFLFFYSENDSKRKETVDSIKALMKQYPDSAKRIISDISVDTDSLAWVNSIRRDSLEGMIRAWMPGGIADPDMVRLGVTRVPWYVVKGKGGSVSYEGDDLGKAVEAFRKAMKNKSTESAGNPKK